MGITNVFMAIPGEGQEGDFQVEVGDFLIFPAWSQGYPFSNLEIAGNGVARQLLELAVIPLAADFEI